MVVISPFFLPGGPKPHGSPPPLFFRPRGGNFGEIYLSATSSSPFGSFFFWAPKPGWFINLGAFEIGGNLGLPRFHSTEVFLGRLRSHKREIKFFLRCPLPIFFVARTHTFFVFFNPGGGVFLPTPLAGGFYKHGC